MTEANDAKKISCDLKIFFFFAEIDFFDDKKSVDNVNLFQI